MAAKDSSPPLTEADISEFGRQLYEWTKSLPQVQRGLLHRILSRAATADAGDSEGFAIAADLTPAEAGAFVEMVRRAMGVTPGPSNV